MLAEGAGAAATAAVLNKKTPNHGKKAGRAGQRREYRCFAAFADYRARPCEGRAPRAPAHSLAGSSGRAAAALRVIAEQKANIVETNHDRAYYGVVLGDTVDRHHDGNARARARRGSDRGAGIGGLSLRARTISASSPVGISLISHLQPDRRNVIRSVRPITRALRGAGVSPAVFRASSANPAGETPAPQLTAGWDSHDMVAGF